MAGAVFDRKPRVATALRRLCIAAGLVLCTAPALAFDYDRYKVADLDDILAQPRPKSGVDLHGAAPLRLEVKLVSYEETCAARAVESTMLMLGYAKQEINNSRASRCIKVRSAKGKEILVFIQDIVHAYLPREVPLGSSLTLFAIHLFTTREGPGLLVNEYEARDATSADAGETGNGPPCGCGTPEFHPGIDVTSDTEGAPVAAMEDDVVVKVEQDDKSAVDFFNIGHCGRYVVLKHSYPNGHVVFTRYAQLGDIVDAEGKPIAVGATVKRSGVIGKVGPTKTLHFEMRPIAAGTTQTDAAWQARYGNDPSMEWSRYDAVDPKKFDPDVFGGQPSKP